MAYAYDGNTAFSNEGFRLRRSNPDGTVPTPANHLGALGTIDCSALIATDVITYRFDGTGAWTDFIVDLSALGASETPTSIQAVLIALAPLQAIFTTSVDGDTGRLKFLDTVGGHDYLEMKGLVSTTLGIGQYGDALAMGTGFVDCFDDTAAINMPRNNKDSEEVEQEAGNGTLQTMLIDAQTRGLNPSIGMTDEKYELKVMFMGGVWDETTKVYTPPTTEIITKPRILGEIFIPKYAKGSMHRGDIQGYKMYDIKNMVGHEADVSHEVKSWANYGFDCQVSEYTISGTKYPGWLEQELTNVEYTALGLPA